MIELESCVWLRANLAAPVMHFYSGPPMHLLSGVDRLLARAHQVQQQLLHERKWDTQGLVQQADPNRTYTALLLRLSWLAPDITHAILRGRQPATLTADKLSRVTRIPLDWQAQREALGFQ